MLSSAVLCTSVVIVAVVTVSGCLWCSCGGLPSRVLHPLTIATQGIRRTAQVVLTTTNLSDNTTFCQGLASSPCFIEGIVAPIPVDASVPRVAWAVKGASLPISERVLWPSSRIRHLSSTGTVGVPCAAEVQATVNLSHNTTFGQVLAGSPRFVHRGVAAVAIDASVPR